MKKVIAIFLLSIVLVSCTKDFKEINTSKNGVKNTTPRNPVRHGLAYRG